MSTTPATEDRNTLRYKSFRGILRGYQPFQLCVNSLSGDPVMSYRMNRLAPQLVVNMVQRAVSRANGRGEFYSKCNYGIKGTYWVFSSFWGVQVV